MAGLSPLYFHSVSLLKSNTFSEKLLVLRTMVLLFFALFGSEAHAVKMIPKMANVNVIFFILILSVVKNILSKHSLPDNCFAGYQASTRSLYDMLPGRMIPNSLAPTLSMVTLQIFTLFTAGTE